MKVFELFAAYLSVCGFLWGVLSKVETILKPQTLAAVAAYLRKPPDARLFVEWAETFLAIAERALAVTATGRGVRKPSVRRTCFASVCLLLLSTLVLSILDSGHGRRNWYVLAGDSVALLACVVAAPPLDYLSVVKTFAILERMKSSSTFLTLLLWLTADFLACVALALVAVFVSGILISYESDFLDWLVYTRLHHPRHYASDSFLYDVLQTNTITAPFIAAFAALISTLLLSMWVWLYGLTSTLVRILNSTAKAKRVIDALFDLDKKPLSVLAAVGILLFTIVYWPICALLR